MPVSRDDVRATAHLARLSFTEREEEDLIDDLNRILDHVDALDSVDTSGVEPMTHVLDLSNRMRPDEIKERINREQALEVASDTDGEFFRVPRVVD